MKKYFIASLCKNGILGGGLTADDTALTFHTGKVTVPKEYRHLEMKYADIVGVDCGWALIFPAVTIKLHRDVEYKFIVFGRRRLVDALKEYVADV